jgi:putative transposase
MYEYRKLSENEREEIRRYRIQQGYPLHAPPHPHHEDGHFLISAAIFEHQHLLSSPGRRTEFEMRLIEGFKQNGCEVHAWIVLPNHYHLLLNTKSFESIPTIVKRLHGSTSREWNLQDGVTGRKVWFNYSDRKIRSERHFFATLNYIHQNSVKHGYVEEATDWPWSSIHLYLADHGADWVVDVSEKYPILDYGRNWDD